MESTKQIAEETKRTIIRSERLMVQSLWTMILEDLRCLESINKLEERLDKLEKDIVNVPNKRWYKELDEFHKEYNRVFRKIAVG